MVDEISSTKFGHIFWYCLSNWGIAQQAGLLQSVPPDCPECTPRLSRIQSSGLLRIPVKVFVASTVYPCRVTEQHSSASTHCLSSKLLAYPLSLFHLLSFSSETLSSQQLPPAHGLLVQTSPLAACFGVSLLWAVVSLGLHCYHLVQ